MATAVQRATKAEQRAAWWARLNDRQQSYPPVIYHADQEAEGLSASAWANGERTGPATQWR